MVYSYDSKTRNEVDHIKVKTALKSSAYNYLNLISDSKSTETLQKLKDKCFILKPGQGQGIVLVNKDDYNNPLENIFDDTSKFQLYEIFQLYKVI